MSKYRLNTKGYFIKYTALIIAFVLYSAVSVEAAEGSGMVGGIGYDWWCSEEGDKGMQLYLPVEAYTAYKGIGIELLGAYVYTQVDPSSRVLYLEGDLSGGSVQALSGFVDTKVNFTYEMGDIAGWDMLAGLGFNLPTGHTNLSQRELKLIVPPDLVSIKRFGEGLNINPRVSVARQWGKVVGGMGIGYTFRGKYDYSEQIESYDPGEILTLTAEAGYDFTAEWGGRVYGEYAGYGNDKVEGDGYYREGDVMLAGMGMQYRRSSWDAGFSLTGIFRGKSKIPQGGSVPTEDRNSHGDEWVTQIAYRYYKDKDTTFKALMEYLYIKENQYANNSVYYIGKRKKITLGCSVDRMISADVGVSAEIRGFIMDDDKNWYHPRVDYRYRGFSLALSAKKNF